MASWAIAGTGWTQMRGNRAGRRNAPYQFSRCEFEAALIVFGLLAFAAQVAAEIGRTFDIAIGRIEFHASQFL